MTHESEYPCFLAQAKGYVPIDFLAFYNDCYFIQLFQDVGSQLSCQIMITEFGHTTDTSALFWTNSICRKNLHLLSMIGAQLWVSTGAIRIRIELR